MPAAHNETDLIQLILENESRQHAGENLILGIGYDAAIIRVADEHDLVTCTDTLVAGVHFPQQTCAYDIGWKSLAVNLSDLAAMGASPRFAQLALTMPAADTGWLQEFMAGWSALASQYGINLIGGDTTRGHLSITVQAMGEVLRGQAIQRGRAQPGDLLVVSGQLGGAALGLRQLQAGKLVDADLLERLNRPLPRVSLGLALRGVASSALDLSDGMALDLQRLLAGTGLGAKIQLDQLPLASSLTSMNAQDRYSLAHRGVDDYELLYSLPAGQQSCLAGVFAETNVPLSVIGEVRATTGVKFLAADGAIFIPESCGYEHFNND
jgi:thiamine-monophosphate kinase